MSELEQLGFDRFQRFQATAELISELAQGRRLDILDVGGLDQALADFLPGHAYRPWPHKVLSHSGGLALPARSQDVVVALDVLEHVPPGQRRYFLGELARVCRLALVVGFPIKTAQQAEAFVLGITGSAWLAEHQEHGLPDPAQVEAILAELGLTFTRHANACLPSWTAMMLLMYGVQDLNLRARISQFFNRQYAPLENREPAYRYIYLCRPG
ncbi:MAG: class I SAM-dependent methyltransferase [Pseudomonadota bacterium]